MMSFSRGERMVFPLHVKLAMVKNLKNAKSAVLNFGDKIVKNIVQIYAEKRTDRKRIKYARSVS